MKYPFLQKLFLLVAFSFGWPLFAQGVSKTPQDKPMRGQVLQGHGFTLENGLSVVVLPSHRAPVVAHMLYYPFGSADDPRGKTGLAHYLEHMMFNGPHGSPSKMYSKLVESWGAEQNAMTTYDFTMYYAIVPSTKLPDIMALEAGRMANLPVIEEEATNELKVVFEEKRMRMENNPFGNFYSILLSHFFQYHPYRNPPIGWEHDLASLNAQNVRDFHKATYGPKGAVLVLWGDVTLEQAQSLAQTHYGPVPSQTPSPTLRLREPSHAKATMAITVRSPHLSHPQWVRLYPTNQGPKKSFRQLIVQRILDHILSVDPWGRFYQTMVHKKKIATGISFGFETFRDAHVAILSAEPSPGVSLAKLESALDDLVKTLEKNPITEKELERSKQQLSAQWVFEADSDRGPGLFFGTYLMMGFSLEELNQRDAILASITLEEIQQLAATTFKQPFALTGRLIPEGKNNA